MSPYGGADPAIVNWLSWRLQFAPGNVPPTEALGRAVAAWRQENPGTDPEVVFRASRVIQAEIDRTIRYRGLGPGQTLAESFLVPPSPDEIISVVSRVAFRLPDGRVEYRTIIVDARPNMTTQQIQDRINRRADEIIRTQLDRYETGTRRAAAGETTLDLVRIDKVLGYRFISTGVSRR